MKLVGNIISETCHNICKHGIVIDNNLDIHYLILLIFKFVYYKEIHY